MFGTDSLSSREIARYFHYMRTQVKHLLRKYKYPPEKAKGAIDIVIKQAELMSSNIKPESVVYDFQPRTKPLMVAEDSVYGMNEKICVICQTVSDKFREEMLWMNW